MTTRVYGWVRDSADDRDLLFSLERPDAGLPKRVDLRETGHLPPIFDQGNLGSCVANASAACLEYHEKKAGEPDVVRSRLFIYYQARLIEHSVKDDAGCMIRDAFKALHKVGACPESEWPYDITKFAAKPPATVHPQKLFEYRRVAQGALALRSALAQGLPVVVGITVYSGFESQAVADSGTVYMPGPQEEALGGHAILLVGYDDDARRWLLQNSWGDGWGQKGFFTLPYEYLTHSHLAGDFWTVEKY